MRRIIRMSGTVKFIFKTLIRVPIIIIIAYTIFNVFGFGLSYFKMLGLSYVAMQTAVENNYIPDNEASTLNSYMANSLESEILEGVSFTDDSDVGYSDRKQYGNTVKVGVQAHYKFVWPLQPKEQTKNETGFDGMNNSGVYQGDKSESELEAAREAYDSEQNNIVIEYEVPGLKYYPDMEMGS